MVLKNMNCIYLLLIIWNAQLIFGNRYVDLTWNFDEKSPYWFGARQFAFSKVSEGNSSGFWYAGKEFCAAEHGGTHLDAPYHFYETGWKVHEIPLDNLIAPGFLVDISKDVEAVGPNATLDVIHINKWIKKNGNIPNKSIMLVRFGWSKYYNDLKTYLGDGKPLFPGLSTEVAQWIVNNTDIVGVGLDTPSIDAGYQSNFTTHRILAEKLIFNMENVKLVENLPPRGFKLFCLPMKIKDGTGAPLRLVAEISEN